MIIVRIPKKIAKKWLAKHEKDGLDQYKIIMFIRYAYKFKLYERLNDILLLQFRFKKRGGKPLRARLWIRERIINNIIELILIKGHVESI